MLGTAPLVSVLLSPSSLALDWVSGWVVELRFEQCSERTGVSLELRSWTTARIEPRLGDVLGTEGVWGCGPVLKTRNQLYAYYENGRY